MSPGGPAVLFDVRFPGEVRDGVARGVLQHDCRCPIRSHWADRLTDGDIDCSLSREVVFGPKYCACPTDGDGDDRRCGLGRGDKCAHVEGP